MRDTPFFTKETGPVISRGSFMAARTANVQMYYLAGDFRDKLNQAMVSKTDSLESLQ